MCFALESWKLLSAGFPEVLKDPKQVDAREKMQLGASFAGMAIEASMLGIAHSLANPLTAKFGTAHGQAVGMMMPHVIRFNASVVEESYAELLHAVAGVKCDASRPTSVQLAELVSTWLERAKLEMNLRALPGWPADRLEEDLLLQVLADDASKQWTATFNPRPVTSAELLTVYQSAL